MYIINNNQTNFICYVIFWSHLKTGCCWRDGVHDFDGDYRCTFFVFRIRNDNPGCYQRSTRRDFGRLIFGSKSGTPIIDWLILK
jgi:hypothetical protein